LPHLVVRRYILPDITIIAENIGRKKGAPIVKIRSHKLTTCQVAADGTNVSLEFLDHDGAQVAVEFPIDQAEAVG